MTLSERQRLFTRLLARLVTWAFEHGYEVVLAEAERTKEQQALYVKQGKSKTMNSAHLKRLAADLLLFKDGVYQTDKPAYAPLGAYWKSLNPACVWGGDWGWDANHFEVKEK